MLDIGVTYNLTYMQYRVYRGIYKITEISSGKVYIGQSINLVLRLRKYTREPYFANPSGIEKIIFENGVDNFTFEILEFTDDLYEREKYYISLYDACNPQVGFNIYKYDRRTFNKLQREASLRGRLQKEDKIISKHN
jgi:group I intron endonuclease